MKRIFAWVGITSGVLGILVLSSVWVVNKRENVPDATGSENYVQKWGGNLPNSDAFAHQDFGFLSKQCRVLEKAQKYDEAVAACEQAIALDPNRENVDLWTNRSNALLKLARYVEAVGSYDQVLQREPKNSFALTQRCAALSALGKPQEAIASCEQALSVNSHWGNATPALARRNKIIALLRKSGKFPDGTTANEQAPGINSNDAISLNQQGRLLQKLKQYEQALTYYNRAIAINPKYSPALAGECETLNQLQKYEQALASCDRALAVDGIMDNISPAYIWHQRSNALLGLKKYEEALTSAQRAISIKQDYAEAWNNKGVSLWNLGKYSEAEATTKRAIDINPKYTQAWFNHGRILSSLQQYERAVIAYDNALSSDVNAVDQSTRASILTNKSAALWHLKNYNLALYSTNEAIQLNDFVVCTTSGKMKECYISYTS